ncbi:antibiotic biosynthesis monooxygenase [Kutzneria chonburiensis]|uniref:Antibiotic biosynthesis monooxygenase n=1 Tax=Kutzneria chonburiensis TaxID=1483604 RepID=A0ABV6N0J2_9PSEU|nr:antibiotic biosynthesis monooxygenase [Kutzneria chonburiensis]
MPKSMMVRYRTTPEAAEENQRLVEAVYRELNADDPGGFRYATFRLADGVTFVHLVAYDSEDDNPLQRSAAFKEFQQDFASRAVESPEFTDVTLVGEYSPSVAG